MVDAPVAKYICSIQLSSSAVGAPAGSRSAHTVEEEGISPKYTGTDTLPTRAST